MNVRKEGDPREGREGGEREGGGYTVVHGIIDTQNNR